MKLRILLAGLLLVVTLSGCFVKKDEVKKVEIPPVSTEMQVVPEESPVKEKDNMSVEPEKEAPKTETEEAPTRGRILQDVSGTYYEESIVD